MTSNAGFNSSARRSGEVTGEHVTDPSNASRTLLFDIHALDWDEELCATFGVPRACLPRVVDSAGVLGETLQLALTEYAGCDAAIDSNVALLLPAKETGALAPTGSNRSVESSLAAKS